MDRKSDFHGVCDQSSVVMAAAGLKEYNDKSTIHYTPTPQVASTANRNSKSSGKLSRDDREEFLMVRNLNEFLMPSTTESYRGIDNCNLSSPRPSGDQSSLGLINLDSDESSSSSLLSLDLIGQAGNRKVDDGNTYKAINADLTVEPSEMSTHVNKSPISYTRDMETSCANKINLIDDDLRNQYYNDFNKFSKNIKTWEIKLDSSEHLNPVLDAATADPDRNKIGSYPGRSFKGQNVPNINISHSNSEKEVKEMEFGSGLPSRLLQPVNVNDCTLDSLATTSIDDIDLPLSNHDVIDSFKLDDLYLKAARESLLGESVLEKYEFSIDRKNSKSQNQIDFASDQISARSSSFGYYNYENDGISEAFYSLSSASKCPEDLGSEISTTEASSVYDASPVFKNDQGEYVTNLAYHTDLNEKFGIENNLSMMSSDADVWDSKDFGNVVSTDAALDMFREEEEKCVLANKFEIGKDTDILYDRIRNDSCVDNSWAVTTQLHDVTVPSLLSSPSIDDEHSFMRLSMGTFMRARTEALGSLDHDENVQRPYFGTEVKSPPQRQILQEDETLPTVIESNEETLKYDSEDKMFVVDKSNRISNICTDSKTNKLLLDEENPTMISVSTISNILSEASLSSDPSALADMIIAYAVKREIKTEKTDVSAEPIAKNSSKVDNIADNWINATSTVVPLSLPNLSNNKTLKLMPSDGKSGIDTGAKTKLESAVGKKLQSERQTMTDVPVRLSSTREDRSKVNRDGVKGKISNLESKVVENTSEDSGKSVTVYANDRATASSLKDKWTEARLSSIYFNKYLSSASRRLPSFLLDNKIESQCQRNSNAKQVPSDSINDFSNVNSQSAAKLSPVTVYTTAVTQSSTLTSVPSPVPSSIMHSSVARRDSTHLPPIIVPSILKFERIQCVGVTSFKYLPVKSHADEWINCRFEIVSLKIRGVLVEPGMNTAFSFVNSLMIVPKTTNELKMTFTPKQEASYEVRIQIILSSQTDFSSRHPTVVTVKASAENPRIKVVDGEEMDFGLLPSGCSKLKSFTLMNTGRVEVPVRLVIRNDSSPLQRFEFYCDDDEDHRVAPSNTISRCLYVAKSTIVRVLFTAGVRNINDIDDIAHIRSFLDVELDVPSPPHSSVFPSIPLAVSVGLAKLHIRCVNQNVLMKSVTNCSVTNSYEMKNSGNIPFNLKIGFFGDEFFSVSPSEVELQPLQLRSINVTLKPVSTPRTINENLMFAVQPNGMIYEYEISAQVVAAPQYLAVQTTTTGMDVLETNRTHVSWGGLMVGSTSVQKLVIRNSSSTNDLRLRALFRGSSDFKFVSTDSVLSNQVITIRSRQELPLVVAYSPKSVCVTDAKLIFRMQNRYRNEIKFTVRLSGYGGISKLKVNNVLKMTPSDSESRHYSNVGSINVGASNVFPFTLTNRGRRTAFVKILAFKDENFREPLPADSYRIKPDEFLLDVDEITTVMIEMVVDGSHHGNDLMEDLFFGSLCFLSGDKISLQKFRNAMNVKSRRTRTLPTLDVDDPCRDVDFRVNFINHSLNEDISASVDDISFFYKSLSRFRVMLFGQPSVPGSNLDITDHRHFSVLAPEEATFNIDQTIQNDGCRHPNLCAYVENDVTQKFSSEPDFKSAKSSVARVSKQSQPVSEKKGIHGAVAKRRQSIRSIENDSVSGTSSKLGDDDDEKPVSVVKSKALTEQKNRQIGPLHLFFDSVTFPNTRCKRSSRVKVMVKNTSSNVYQLKVSPLKLPFVVNYDNLTIMAKSYISIPVVFRPTVPGKYSDILTLYTKLPYDLRVTFEGHATL